MTLKRVATTQMLAAMKINPSVTMIPGRAQTTRATVVMRRCRIR